MGRPRDGDWSARTGLARTPLVIPSEARNLLPRRRRRRRAPAWAVPGTGTGALVPDWRGPRLSFRAKRGISHPGGVVGGVHLHGPSPGRGLERPYARAVPGTGTGALVCMGRPRDGDWSARMHGSSPGRGLERSYAWVVPGTGTGALVPDWRGPRLSFRAKRGISYPGGVVGGVHLHGPSPGRGLERSYRTGEDPACHSERSEESPTQAAS